jgi:ATP-dependent DNA helicase RecQ
MQVVRPPELPEPLVQITDEALLSVLKSSFGYDSFRGSQLAVIKAVLSGESTLAIMPTGT